MAIARSKDQAYGPTVGIDLGMNLRVRSAATLSNCLVFRGISPSTCMFVNFGARRVDTPQLPLGGSAKGFENTIPAAFFAPLFPTSVDGRVRCEDAQSSPAATLTQAKQKSL
jgi:hypothetical protein